MKHTYMLGVPRTNCKDYGIKTVNIPRSRKDASHGRLLEFHMFDLCREMPVSSASKLLGMGPDAIWTILKYYVDEARSSVDLSHLKNIGVDEIAIMKEHNYESVFYDHGESRVIHTEMGKKNTVFRKLKKILPEPKKVDLVNVERAFRKM